MKRYGKIFTFILFCLISFSGLMYGCAGKYDNVKVTSDKDESGLQLYIGEDTEGDMRSVGTITFYVEGLENGANNLKFNFEGYEESRIVKILNKSVSGNSVEVQLQAISGGSTKLVALTEAGMKYDAVQVDCIRRLENFSFTENYSPAMFNEVGSRLTLDTKKINFSPSDTTQNKVTYSVEPSIDGVDITAGGVLTLNQKVAGPINVFARSTENQSIFDSVLVHLIEPIENEDGDGIEIFTESNLYKDGKITLTSTGDESFIIFRVDVNTTENIVCTYKLENVSDSASGNVNCVNIEQNQLEFKARANDIGECKLVLSIGFADYDDAPVVEKEIAIKVVELPKTITVNDQTENFADNIYTYYENNKGKEYVVNIGEFRAYNKTFMLAISDSSLIEVKRNDGQKINFATFEDGIVSADGDILQSGQSIFVKGLAPNQTAKLYIIARGTVGFKTLLVREIGLNILLGSETVEPVERTFDGEPNSVYYVELGKSFELDYIIDENSSAYGIQLVKSDGGNLDGVVSAQVTEGLKPTITVTGTELGEISCKLLLENLIESHAFTIKVFKPVEYVDEEQNGGVYFFVDSPLENPNIASSEYVYVGTNKTLYSFVLSIGTTVQLKNLINPSDATIHNISYASYILRGENEPESGIEYLYVSDSGNVTARKMFPETVIIDEQEVSQKLAVYVTVESLATDENGDVIKITSTKIIYVEIYLPISDVKISKTQSTIYWNNGTSLNPVQVDAGVYSDAINLKVYSDAINLSKVHVNWDCPYALSIATNGLNATISAFDMPENAGEKSIYTVTATIQYYSTTIVRRCIFTVVKPTRASTLVAYINDIESDTAYFEFGENDIQPSSIDIQSAVYSASGKKDVTFDKVYFMSRNENVATVDENGKITPVGAGQTEIWVYAEDMMPSLYSIGSFKVIKVIVADGITKDTAIRIRNKDDFAKFMSNPNRFYYFSSDVAISNQYYVQSFEGNLDGNGYSLIGVKLDNIHTSMFGEISQDAEISNLNISASYDIEANSDLSIAGLAQTNKGTIDNVNIYFVKSAVKVTVENINVNIAGLVIQNDEFAYINASSVSANFEVLADATYNIQSLNIGGLVATNNQSSFAYGTNQNYEYRPLSLIQEFDFSGSIKISQNVSAANSAIGGIFAINESNIYDQYQSIDGFASNIVINAPTINNVGGIVGINNGSIQNVLVEANIVANNNVGGIAGKSIGIIDNAIVEMYQHVSNQEISGKVQGNENVGGIVGYLQGLEDIQNSTYVNALVKNSYVFAYAEQSLISGNNNVGGIAGFAEFADIEKSYAHVKIDSNNFITTEDAEFNNEKVYYEKNNGYYFVTHDDNLVSGKLYYEKLFADSAGGIVGYANNISITNAFAIVDDESISTFGSAVGKADSNVEIVNFYSTSAGNMAGDGVVESIDCHIIENEITLESLKNINTYFKVTSDTEFNEQKTYYELQDSGEYVKTADTIFDSTKTYYENPWRISADNLYDENLNYYDWFISAEKNDGYPILIYEGFLMRKLQPSQINIAPEDNIESTNNNVVVLLADRLYALSDVLNITTDVTSKASIYVYSNIDGILNTKNTTNLLSNRATLKSSKEQVITLTFVLGNNPSIREQIQIAFIQRPIDFTVDPVSIKLNQTIALNSKITFAENEVVAFKGLTNYKLGINESDITNDEIQISNAENLNGIILFDGDSLITGNAQFNDALSLTLYYKLVYFDLNGNLQTEYINIKNDRSVTVNVFVGATDIHISTTSIDMTLIDAVTFTVTLDTDDASDKLVVKSNASNSLIEYVGSEDIIGFDKSIVSSNPKLELSVIEGPDYQEGKLTVTFQLKFNDIYLDANSGYKFSQMFIETLNFKSKSNIEVAGNLQITAKPQNLLKIDLTNYAAVQKVGEKFNLYDNIPSNTLVPGQIGMLVVDIYPKYANYDEIQLISGVTSNGKAIKFIQIAKYSEEQYLEIRPNLNTIENGIILRQYSNVHFNKNNEPVYDFDGRFYLNTIISSNVNHDEIVTITAIGITYVKDENGNTTQTRQIIKTIDITVKPAPELSLTKTDADIYEVPVYSKDKSSYDIYNIAYRGQVLKFQVEQKNGLKGFELNINVYYKENGNEKPVYYRITSENEYITTFEVYTSSVEEGKVINISVVGSKNINGFVEKYYGKDLKFLIANYTITNNGIRVKETTDNKMKFTVNVPKSVTAEILVNKSEQLSQYLKEVDKLSDDDIKKIIDDGKIKSVSEYESYINATYYGQTEDKNTKKSFWSGYVNGYTGYTRWDLSKSNDFEGLYTKSYSTYTVYKSAKDKTFSILATNKADETSKFKVGFDYYYVLDGDNLTLEITPQDESKLSVVKTVECEVSMDMEIRSDLDDPIAIYTVEDFYSMTTGLDYILMNDLYFGYENAPEGIESSSVAKDYTPFDLTANSFDGNMHEIHINGNCFNFSDSGTAEIALFTSISTKTIFKDLDIVYEDAIKIGLEETTMLSSSTIYFSGAVVRNSGVISNVNVLYNGDINITASSSDGEVYIAGFAYENSGKITYSSVYGKNLNDELNSITDNSSLNSNTSENNLSFSNVKLASASYGNIAGFIGTNSDLLSNCQVSYVGIQNTSPASRNSKVAGFAIVNSGTIYNSSAAGQQVNHEYGDDINTILPLKKNDNRQFKNITISYNDSYFARLENNGNIAGFVYTNSGSIENAYSIFPMETQSRTAGFVFDNSNRGSVLASYTASFYDGTNTNNSAYSPFVGTNELGEVLNDSQQSVVRYCYYLLDTQEVYEEDITFKEPASRISIDLKGDSDVGSVATAASSYKGFDIKEGGEDTIWSVGSKNEYLLPMLNSNIQNQSIRAKFERPFIIGKDLAGNPKLIFGRVKDESAPYQIADALQFVNVFNYETTRYGDTYYLNHSVRLINDIDLSEYAGTPELNKIRQVVYSGDFDGNGMTISGIKLIGGNTSTNSDEENPYLYSKSSFGLFNQIGTATIGDNYNKFDGSLNNTKVRSLTLKVDEVSKSTSVFTGILAGIIVNADIKSVKIQSNNIYVLGGNAVGGLAGGVFGSSTLYNISVNANVTSSYREYIANSYRDKTIGDGTGQIKTYAFVDYSIISGTKIYFDERTKIYFDERTHGSYAGGVAGIIDLYQASAQSQEVLYGDNYQNISEKLVGADRAPNVNVVSVYGDVSMIGEIVGGLFGTVNEDTYIANSSFEVSSSTNQKLQGYYTAGGLVGIVNGAAIRLSKVEIGQSLVDSYDNNLTNQTGNTLFDTQTYPFAIGGLVGIQNGGYIITCYSKTNVINARAKYAGGVVGCLTDYESKYTGSAKVDGNNIDIKNLKNGRFVLFEEVYSTGNVFAGDDFKTSETLNLDTNNDGTNDAYTATPTSYVGGIVGCYKPNQSINNKNYDAFNGVIGINAFHMPTGYVVPTEYKVNGTTSPTYADIMAGYTGTKTKADGNPETKVFLSRIGSIFGYVDVQAGITVNYSEIGAYNNLYTNFVYAKQTISANDCTSGNGREINYVANDASFGTFNIGNNIDKFNVINVNTDETQVQVTLNSSAVNPDSSAKIKPYVKPSESYLVLRGYGDRVVYQQNENGIYTNWADNWEFKSHIYPSFKPTTLLEYIEIRTEDDLKNVRSGNKYKLVDDIYLSETWNGLAHDLSFTTIISAKRNDGLGIKLNGEKSSYYAIYNINMIDSSNSDNFGFIKSLRYSTIKNINFVYGTNVAKDNKSGTGNFSNNYGFDYSGSNNQAKNVGLLVGEIKQASTIEGCHIFMNTDGNSTTANYEVNNNKVQNFGVVAGAISESNIIDAEIFCGQINVDTNSNYQKTATNDNSQLSISVKAQNAGFAVGLSDNSYIDATIGNFKLTFTPNTDVVQQTQSFNIGGIVGNFAYSDAISQNFNGKVKNINIEVASNAENNSIYAGGVAGNASVLKAKSIDAEQMTIYNSSNFANAYVGGLFGLIYSSDVKNLSTGNITLTFGGNVGTSKFIGGLAGKLDSTSSFNLKQDETINTITITNSGTFTENNKVGGIAGELNNAAIKDITISGITITDNSKGLNNNGTDESKSYIALAFGQRSGSGIIDKVKVSGKIENGENGKANNLYIAGFVANVVENATDSINNSINNSYAQGSIIHRGSSSGTYLAGFAGTGISSSNTNSLNATKIENCVSDVQILFMENDENVKVAGFAVEGFKTIGKCASVGDVIFASSITSAENFKFANELFTGKAAGFTCMDSSGNPTIQTCYSFSTMKLIGKKLTNGGTPDVENPNVKATSFSSDHQIFYNYNLSGVFNIADSKAKFNNKDLNLTYTELLETIETISDNKLLLGVYPIGNSGKTKLNPTPYVENNITYYNFYNNTYIANDSSKLTTIDINSFNVGNKNSYLAGFTISSPIGTNSGYLFNCSMVGDSGDSGFSTTGFVGTNNGLINACGTNAIIDANGQTNVAGFVINNTGIIANSYAANIYKNQTNADSISGFVDTNNGYIYNCYSSPAMFDVTESTTDRYKNRKLFFGANDGTIEYCYCDNQTDKSDTTTTQTLMFKNYNDMVNKSEEMFNKTSNDDQNYGYVTPFTYEGSSSTNIGYVGTGKNTVSLPYVINNYGRFAYLINNKCTNLLDKMFNATILVDIDARSYTNTKLNGINWGKDAGTILVNNYFRDNKTYSIYGAKINNSSTGLFSAKTIQLNSFGLYGEFSGSTTFSASKGFLVGESEDLTAYYCFAVLNSNVTINNSEISFGVFAGNVTNSVYIYGSLAYVETITVSEYAQNSNVGVMIGQSNNATIKNSHTAGTINIKHEGANVGGFAGKLNNCNDWSSNMSYVLLKNYTNNNKVRPDFGKTSASDFILDYSGALSLNNPDNNTKKYKGVFSNETGTVHGLGNFTDNSIISKELLYEGSLLNPKKLENNSTTSGLYYYLDGNITLTNSISYDNAPKMIIGNNYTITINPSSNSNQIRALISSTAANQNFDTIISTLKINNGILCNTSFNNCYFSGYAYSVETCGTVNSSVGFVNTEKNAVFDKCYSNVTIDRDWCNITGFTSAYNGGIYKNINVNVTVKKPASYNYIYFGGMFYSIKQSMTSAIVDIDSIHIKLEGTYSKNCYIGGIVPSYSENSIDIENIYIYEFVLDGINNDNSSTYSVYNYIGGIAGLFNNSIKNVTIEDVQMNDIVVKDSYSSAFAYNYIGGIVGSCSGDIITAQITSVSFNNCSAESSNNNACNYIGGIVGNVTHKISLDNCTVESFDCDLISATSNYIGGIAGYILNCNNVTCSVEKFNINHQKSGFFDISYGINGSTLYLGGIIGYMNNGSIEMAEVNTFECGTTGNYQINCVNNVCLGGIIGYMNNGSIKTAEVDTFTCATAGGLILFTINSDKLYLGGIIGYMNNGSIETAEVDAFTCATARHSVNSTYINIGGILGRGVSNSKISRVTITGSYELGYYDEIRTYSEIDVALYGKDKNLGGIAGYLAGNIITARLDKLVYFKSILNKYSNSVGDDTSNYEGYAIGYAYNGIHITNLYYYKYQLSSPIGGGDKNAIENKQML